MQKKNKPHLITYGLLLAVLFASLFSNLFLFQKAKTYYAREASVRMNPVSNRFAQANQELLAQPKTKTRLLKFGESRCAMWKSKIPTNWGDLEIINRGIGGETTPQIIRRLEQDVIALSPDIVILQMGDNDLKTIAVLPGTREKTIKSTYENIVQIARTLSDHGIRVVITTIFPPAPAELLRKPLWSDQVNESIDLVNKRLLEFKYPRVQTVDCDPVLRDGMYIKPEYSIDTLHIKPTAYHALNLALAPTITQLTTHIPQ